MTYKEAVEHAKFVRNQLKDASIICLGAEVIDALLSSPWKPATEMPADTLCYCRDEADGRPYLAQICGETGECFGEDMEVCFPKYFMLIPPTEKEEI